MINASAFHLGVQVFIGSLGKLDGSHDLLLSLVSSLIVRFPVRQVGVSFSGISLMKKVSRICIYKYICIYKSFSPHRGFPLLTDRILIYVLSCRVN